MVLVIILTLTMDHRKLRSIEDRIGWRNRMKLLTQEQFQSYISSMTCHICELEIVELSDEVRDHCHYSGEYRGPAHKKCNMDYRKPKFLPIVAQNMSRYDMHLIIKHLASDFPYGSLGAISGNTKRNISFSVDVATKCIPVSRERKG